MQTKIEQTRRLQLPWDTCVIVNDHDRPRSYQMTIPARPQADGTSLMWLLRYGEPDLKQRLSACSIIESYEYLLSEDMTAGEAINRLRCLRREYRTQGKPKPYFAEAPTHAD